MDRPETVGNAPMGLQLNPSRIVPAGPRIDFSAPH